MNRSRERGVTLIELVVVLGLTGLLIALVINAMIDLDRTRRPREVAAEIQGEGRTGLALLEDDLRLASLGASTGVLRTNDPGAIDRPMVQVIDDVPALEEGDSPSGISIKANTDALLVVRAEREPSATVITETVDLSTIRVHPRARLAFAADQRVLLGEYGDVAWARVTGARPTGDDVDLDLAGARMPGANAATLKRGSFVRRALARLYYVDPQDRLVRVDLDGPRLKSGVTVSNFEVLAQGIENLQIGCGLDDGTAAVACPDPRADALATEIEEALGVTFGAGQGPRLGTDNIPNLRTLSLSIGVRSRTPMVDANQGDPKVALEDAPALPVGGSSDDAPYVRRTYQITVGVRNTSLGVL